MSLYKKTWVIAGSLFIIYLVLFVIIASAWLLERYRLLEEDMMHENVGRVLNAISQDMTTLSAIASDWAIWDDTYTFIEDRNDDYIQSNLVDGTFSGLGLNAMIYVNSSGTIVYSKAFDLINNEAVAVPSSLVEHFTGESPLLVHPNSDSGHTGILLLPEGPMLLAFQPILTSEEAGPSRGTLLMGRYLDEDQIQQLSERTDLAIAMLPFDLPESSTVMAELVTTQPGENSTLVRTINKNVIAGYSILEDIYGQPALILKISMQRDVYNQGLRSILFFIGSHIAIGLLLIIATLIILNKSVIKKFSLLSEDLKMMINPGDLSKRVRVSGNDEVTRMASDINAMLEVLEDNNKSLAASEEWNRTLVEAFQDSLFIIDRQGCVKYVNDYGANLFRMNAEEMKGKSITELFPPELAKNLKANVLHVFDKGEPVWKTSSIPFPSRIIWMSTGLFPIRAADGSIQSVLGISRDITEQKRMSEALQVREKRFRNIFKYSPISLWEEDISRLVAKIDELQLSGVSNLRSYFGNAPQLVYEYIGLVEVIDINQATLDLYQAKSKGELLDNINKIYCEETLPSLIDEMVAIAEGKTRFSGETVNLTLHGERTDILLNSEIIRDKHENQYRRLVSARDITREKQNTEALAQKNKELDRSNDQLEELNNMISLVNDMSNLFQLCETRQEIFSVISSHLSLIFKNTGGILYELDPSLNKFKTIANSGKMAQVNEQEFDSDSCWALRKGRIHNFNTEGDGIVCEHLNPYAPTSTLCIPLVSNGVTRGLFSLITSDAAGELEEAFSSENRKKIALIIAETISLALTNMDMREKLYEQSIRDPLTNLYNRRYMEETLDREIRLAEHKHTSLAVIMIDIDHFKNFNDNFGHEAGDEVLKNIGWLMQSQARVSDIACRYGGEEFVIILPDSTLSDSWQRMDALRIQIDQLNLSSNGKELSDISISGGLVEFPTNGKTSSQLLQAADQALYRAKTAGRNRIETADHLLPTE